MLYKWKTTYSDFWWKHLKSNNNKTKTYLTCHRKNCITKYCVFNSVFGGYFGVIIFKSFGLWDNDEVDSEPLTMRAGWWVDTYSRQRVWEAVQKDIKPYVWVAGCVCKQARRQEGKKGSPTVDHGPLLNPLKTPVILNLLNTHHISFLISKVIFIGKYDV